MYQSPHDILAIVKLFKLLDFFFFFSIILNKEFRLLDGSNTVTAPNQTTAFWLF
jgi:hypothetical protein